MERLQVQIQKSIVAQQNTLELTEAQCNIKGGECVDDDCSLSSYLGDCANEEERCKKSITLHNCINKGGVSTGKTIGCGDKKYLGEINEVNICCQPKCPGKCQENCDGVYNINSQSYYCESGKCCVKL